jgi:hypothetical protein
VYAGVSFMSTKKEDRITEGDAGLKRLDDVFGAVLSVSNKTVQRALAAEKRERTPRGPKPSKRRRAKLPKHR